MLALYSTDCDVDGKCSLLTFSYTSALVNVLKWALLPGSEREGKNHPSSAVLKALHLFQCCTVIFPPE